MKTRARSLSLPEVDYLTPGEYKNNSVIAGGVSATEGRISIIYEMFISGEAKAY